jgi:hypothetical protein
MKTRQPDRSAGLVTRAAAAAAAARAAWFTPRKTFFCEANSTFWTCAGEKITLLFVKITQISQLRT